jgi:hypothetical protein
MRIFYIINPKTKSPQQLPDSFKKEWLKDFMLDNQIIIVNQQIYDDLKKINFFKKRKGIINSFQNDFIIKSYLMKEFDIQLLVDNNHISLKNNNSINF